MTLPAVAQAVGWGRDEVVRQIAFRSADIAKQEVNLQQEREIVAGLKAAIAGERET